MSTVNSRFPSSLCGKRGISFMVVTSLIVLVMAIPCSGKSSLGAVYSQDFSDQSNWYGIYLKTGGFLMLEISALAKMGENPLHFLRLFPYLLVNFPFANVDLYFGMSPSLIVYPNVPDVDFDATSAYTKAGLQLNFYPLCVLGEFGGAFSFSGGWHGFFANAGFGFSFR